MPGNWEAMTKGNHHERKKRIFSAAGGESFSRERFGVLLAFFAVAFAVLYYRSFHLHVMADQRLEKLTKNQYTTRLDRAAPRGNIYDIRGEALAVTVPTDSLALRPNRVKDQASFIEKLDKVISLSKSEISEKVSSNKKYLWVKRGLSPAESQMLRKDPIEGLELVKEAKRFYPNRELASQILGAVGRDGEGLGGVELYYEDYLRGDADKGLAFRDARGKTLQTDESVDLQEDVSHLYLTLHKGIQYAVETTLEETCKTYQAKTCTSVVMDPRTGAILAMASYPHFNPNQYGDYDLALWKNKAVTDSFEPGSIFKVVLSAAALESGLVKPDDKFFCEQGIYKIGSNAIHDHERYGVLSLREILKFSSNIGTYKVAQKIGKQVFARVFQDFGFGKRMGIDYPGEATGLVRPVGGWQEIDFANIAFGQGIGVTPLQIASAFSTIAAGGVRMKPYLVSKISDANNQPVWEAEPTPIKRVISEGTARQLRAMMKGVTEEGGTGTKASLPGYSVAGMTGTAQKIENGHYNHGKFMSSFVGFIPADQPRLTILVTVDEPQGQIYGGAVAAPAFRKIAWEALRELGVSPTDGPGLPQKRVSPILEASVMPTGVEQALGLAKEAGTRAALSLQASDLLRQKAPVEEPRAVLPHVATGSVSANSVVPDLSGLSMRQVLRRLEQNGLMAKLEGSGLAFEQRPVPGTTTKRGDVCLVSFRPRNE